jgi:hypothetical protein
MPFDIIAWSLGWTLGKIGDSIIRSLTPSELRSRLSNSIESWTNALPAERYVDARAIFASSDVDPGPARRLLFERLIDSNLPTEQEWHLALVERWRTIVRGTSAADLQPFFRLTESEASSELLKLATRLTAVCRGDERMYRNATVGLNHRIHEWQIGTPVMLINEIDEPERWNSSYYVHFHLHNGSDSSLLVAKLQAVVDEVAKINRFAAKTPGAATIEHSFTASLVPTVGPTKLVPLGPSRFTLRPGETEFFNVEIHADGGWDYLVRLSAVATKLHDGTKFDVSTARFWMSFEG